MRALFYTLFLCTIIGCDSPVKPVVFNGMSDLFVQDLTLQNVTIFSRLNYHNPNPIGMNVERTAIDVTVNDIDVGEVKLLNAVKIEGNSDFKFPVTISFPPSYIMKNDGLLQSALQVIGNKKANVHYKGTVTFMIAGVEVDYPVDYIEEIPLKRRR